MRKKCLTLVGIGFLGGMLMGNLIAWFCGGTLVNTRLMNWIGNDIGAVVIQTLFSGLLGAVSMGGVIVYDIESWPLLRCTIVHYLVVETAYLAIASLLGWYGSLGELLVVLGIQLVAYFLIWVFMYLRWKAQVRKLNELLKKSHRKSPEK